MSRTETYKPQKIFPTVIFQSKYTNPPPFFSKYTFKEASCTQLSCRSRLFLALTLLLWLFYPSKINNSKCQGKLGKSRSDKSSSFPSHSIIVSDSLKNKKCTVLYLKEKSVKKYIATNTLPSLLIAWSISLQQGLWGGESSASDISLICYIVS